MLCVMKAKLASKDNVGLAWVKAFVIVAVFLSEYDDYLPDVVFSPYKNLVTSERSGVVTRAAEP